MSFPKLRESPYQKKATWEATLFYHPPHFCPFAAVATEQSHGSKGFRGGGGGIAANEGKTGGGGSVEGCRITMLSQGRRKHQKCERSGKRLPPPRPPLLQHGHPHTVQTRPEKNNTAKVVRILCLKCTTFAKMVKSGGWNEMVLGQKKSSDANVIWTIQNWKNPMNRTEMARRI